MKKISILTDSTCDLSVEFMNENNIKFLPVTIDLNGEIFKDKVDITNEYFFNRIGSENIQPKTAQITPISYEQAFEEELKKGNDVICITLSSKLSGCYNSALVAKNTLNSDNIHVIDSQTACGGIALLVLEALRKIEEGYTATEVVFFIDNLISKQDCMFSINDMEMLKRGGRISSAKALIGGILGVKPILRIENGSLIYSHKVKGKGNMIKELINAINNSGFNDNHKVCLYHSNALESIEKIKSSLIDMYPNTDIFIGDIGTAIGAHTGEGTIAIFFIKK